MRKRASFPLCALALFMAGCSFAPSYKQPKPKIADQWPKDAKAAPVLRGAPPSPASELGWEDFFTDPRLKALIELALKNNQSLAGQIAAIQQARGQYMMQNASLFPPISVGGGAQYQNPSDTAGFSFSPGSGRGVDMLRFYHTSIGFSSYEIDLWGRIRNMTKAQKEATLSQAENLRNLWITVISQIATTYVQWLGDREQYRLADSTLASQRQTLKLQELNYKQGQLDAMTLAQVRTQVDQALAALEQSRRAVAADEHLLALLAGGPLPENLPAPRPFGSQIIAAELPPGLPAALLTQRPDIMSAEHQLIGANAQIGAARAAFLPRFTLTASEGTSSLTFNHLFSNWAETWGVNPQVSIPIFTWGQNLGNLKSASASQKQMLANYQKTIQTAFREVADALTARDTYGRQTQAQKSLARNSREAYDLAQMRFRQGIDNYLTTLVSQRNWFQAQQNLILVQAARYQNMITLYRALGGGWRRKSRDPAKSEKQNAVEQRKLMKTGIPYSKILEPGR